MSTVHVRARTAQIAALPGRRSSLSRYPCCSQYSAAEIDGARYVAAVAAPGRPLRIGVKPAASGVPSTRPDSPSRFFRPLPRSRATQHDYTRQGAAQ
jgi:hypothetical protein